MRRCIKHLASLMIICSTLLSAVSCSKELDFGFKDLCFYHPHTAPVVLSVDWSVFRKIDNPSGMSVYVWNSNKTQDNLSKYLTHNINEDITLNLKQGFYNVFVFNQSENEYATLEFHNMTNFEQAEIRVKQMKSNWYSTKHNNTKVGQEPEWLAIDCMPEIEVTEEMVKKAEEEFLATLNKKQTRNGPTQNRLQKLVPKTIIKKIDIYIHLENLQFLRSALAAMENMAEGCMISTKQTTSNHVTHTISDWKLIFEKNEDGTDDKTRGALKATITTFGLPQGHNGAPTDNNFFAKLLLIDDKTIVEANFPIGNLIADLNKYDGTQLDLQGNVIWPELHLNWPEPLPPVEPLGGDGGFNVGVGEWGDEVVTILPI